MTTISNQVYADKYFEYLNNRSSIRRFIRKFYLKDIAKYCVNKTIDFGCGIGELLKILPKGSIGFEVNEVAVRFCKSNGLQVELYNPDLDDYQFRMIKEDEFNTFSMNHVLEHLKDPKLIINKIFKSCFRLGISTVVFTVPGFKGYKSDKTHLTYINWSYLNENGLLESDYYNLKTHKYFPFNLNLFGRFFTHNELRLVYKRKL